MENERQNQAGHSTRTYRGSCHCKKVRFQVDLDLSQGTGRCNCSLCVKTRKWGALCKTDAFRLLGGDEHLSDYRARPDGFHDYFCSTCGVRTHGTGRLEELGGDFVSINLGALDDITDEERVAAPITYFDGRNDAWWERPAETRYL